MADALRRRTWTARLSWAALLLSVGAVLLALIGAVGSGQGAWGFRTGFQLLQYALIAAALAVIVGLVAWWRGRKVAPRGHGLINLIALVVALAFLFYLGSQIVTARSVPAIHDATTNLNQVPSFYRLRVRDDNLDSIPGEDDPRYAGLTPKQRWKAIHAEAYGDLRSVRVPLTVPETIARAEAIARDRGWEIATSDPAAGILEATDTTRFFRFKDDVVVRARPHPDGGSVVDMRSISRVGASDVGVNAARIRDFLADLRAAG